MRLKTLRKERPSFENEGAVINGCRIDLTNSDSKPVKHRTNTSFALPTSLSTELFSSDEMNNRSRQPIIIPVETQTANISSYQAIEAAYLERGIRIRVSPPRSAVSAPQTRKKSGNSLQRHSAFTNRNPSRTSSVLHYATTKQEHDPDTRSFSALHESSSNDFDHTEKHNVSYAHSSQVHDEIREINYSPTILVSERSASITPSEKFPHTQRNLSTPVLPETDPDLAYMSSLLQKSNGDSFRDAIRRRAGLRATFTVHRNSLATNSIQAREKTPLPNRTPLTRNSTIAVTPVISPEKIDQDILKHVLRIRRTSQSKDNLVLSSRIDTKTPTPIPPSRINSSSIKQSSMKKSLNSISLEPIALLTPAPRSASLSVRDIPTNKPLPTTRHLTTPTRRTKSAKISMTTTDPLLADHSTSSILLQDESSLSLMRTSPLNTPRQTNSSDSGCYDRSSSSGDLQSLTSSSIARIASSIPSERLTNSTRRSHTNKKVSFYEEPTTFILTTATYV